MLFEIVQFEDFELDRSAYQLRCGGAVVKLERIPLELLFLLVNRRPQIVTRDEILEHVWGKGVFIDVENSINSAMRKLRRALNDDAEAPRFVATIPSKGYRFVAKVRSRAPAALRAGQGRLVGRERELGELRAALGDASSGRGRIVLISGEAGVGKTRISEELATLAHEAGFRLLIGHCSEHRDSVPHLPFVEILESLVDYAASPDVLRAQLGDEAPILARLLPRLKRILPDLRDSTDWSPEQARRELFNSFCDFLGRLAREQATLLVLEDLHWADDAALSLLDHVAHRLSDLPLLIVGTHRDAVQDLTPPLAKTLEELSRGRLATVVRLRGLPRGEVAQMLTGLSGQAPPERVVSEICAETGGNPFYIEELFRHLVEENRLYDPEGRFRNALEIGELEAPRSVRLIVGRRLERLGQHTQEMLGTAAVIGRVFSFEVLRAASNSEGLLECLEEAEGAALIHSVTSIPEARYTFSHELTRQAVLSGLSSARRQQLHSRSAQAIESVYQLNLDPHISTLAIHYRLAGAGDSEKAIDYSIRAGDAAYAVFAYEEAATHWRAAMEMMDEQGGNDPKLRARMLSLLGDELISSGPAAIAYLEEAATLYDELGDEQGGADVHARLGLYLSGPNLGSRDVPRAMAHFQKAEALLARQPESLSHAKFNIFMAAACIWARRLEEGLAAGRRAMEIARRTKNERAWIDGAILSCWFLVFRGSVAEGLRLANEARRRATPIDDTMLGSTVAWNGGGMYHWLCDPREARNWYLDELSLPRTSQSAPRRTILHHFAAYACVDIGSLAEAREHLLQAGAGTSRPLALMEGDWESADKLLTESLELAKATGDRWQETNDAFAIALLYRIRGDFERAEEYARRGLSMAIETGDVSCQLWGWPWMAIILDAQGRAREVIPQIEWCREILAQGEDWRGIAAGVARAEAIVAAAQGRYEDADRQFKNSIAAFNRYALPWEEAETRRLWGCSLAAEGKRARSVEQFDAAIEMYRSRGAGARWIERIQADKLRTSGTIATGRATGKQRHRLRRHS